MCPCFGELSCFSIPGFLHTELNVPLVRPGHVPRSSPRYLRVQGNQLSSNKVGCIPAQHGRYGMPSSLLPRFGVDFLPVNLRASNGRCARIAWVEALRGVRSLSLVMLISTRIGLRMYNHYATSTAAIDRIVVAVCWLSRQPQAGAMERFLDTILRLTANVITKARTTTSSAT